MHQNAPHSDRTLSEPSLHSRCCQDIFNNMIQRTSETRGCAVCAAMSSTNPRFFCATARASPTSSSDYTLFLRNTSLARLFQLGWSIRVPCHFSVFQPSYVDLPNEPAFHFRRHKIRLFDATSPFATWWGLMLRRLQQEISCAMVSFLFRSAVLYVDA